MMLTTELEFEICINKIPPEDPVNNLGREFVQVWFTIAEKGSVLGSDAIWGLINGFKDELVERLEKGGFKIHEVSVDDFSDGYFVVLDTNDVNAVIESLRDGFFIKERDGSES